MSYPSSIPNNYNSAHALVASTVKKLVFKNAAGTGTRAKRIIMRFDSAKGTTVTGERIFYKQYNRHGVAASADPADDANFFCFPGEIYLCLEGVKTAELRFLALEAKVKLYIEAYSDEDISGTTFA